MRRCTSYLWRRNAARTLGFGLSFFWCSVWCICLHSLFLLHAVCQQKHAIALLTSDLGSPSPWYSTILIKHPHCMGPNMLVHPLHPPWLNGDDEHERGEGMETQPPPHKPRCKGRSGSQRWNKQVSLCCMQTNWSSRATVPFRLYGLIKSPTRPPGSLSWTQCGFLPSSRCREDTIFCCCCRDAKRFAINTCCRRTRYWYDWQNLWDHLVIEGPTYQASVCPRGWNQPWTPCETRWAQSVRTTTWWHCDYSGACITAAQCRSLFDAHGW